MRVIVVTLSGYVSVTTLSQTCDVCDKLNLPARSSLNYKGFQHADFAKKLSFPSYSLFFTFTQPKAAIFNH